ncbi:MAG: LysE family translocator [Sphingomonas sp.]
MPDHLIAFTIAATLLTLTPGLDTALILRTTASEGARRAMMAGLGIALGCFAWGIVVAIGLGALLAASRLAYDMLRWIGAAYLLYLGIKLIRSPQREFAVSAPDQPSTSGAQWLARGFLTNILNPKVGVFYVSFLPQFIASDANVAVTTILLTAIHALLGIAWFASLILATRPIARLLRRGAVVTWLDRVTGGVFVAFGIRLAAAGSR